jgi:hypothetical protein
MTIDAKRLEEIRARLAAATPRYGDVIVAPDLDADATLAINAPADLADLLAEVERLGRTLQWIADHMEDHYVVTHIETTGQRREWNIDYWPNLADEDEDTETATGPTFADALAAAMGATAESRP